MPCKNESLAGVLWHKDEIIRYFGMLFYLDPKMS